MNPTSTVFTFEPTVSDLWTYIFLGIALLLAGIGTAVYANRLPTTEDKRKRLLLPYLGFILAIIAMMLIVGNIWQLNKFPTLTLSRTVMTIDGETQRMPRRSEFRVEREEVSAGSWGKSQNILLLRAEDGTTYALPENRYNLPQMLSLIEQALADN
ncbi:MAG: hypothetical protein AAF433_18900 [Bacteroidota bacterium]